MQEKESIIIVRCELEILSPGSLKILICVYACKNLYMYYTRAHVCKLEISRSCDSVKRSSIPFT